jgi:hypothetical protein
VTLERQMTSTLLPDCAIKLQAAPAELLPDVGFSRVAASVAKAAF